MTPFELSDLADRYDRVLASKVQTFRQPGSSAGDLSPMPLLAHARWLCGEIQTMAARCIQLLGAMATSHARGEAIKEDILEARLLEGRACRYLGFVQGLLWATGVHSLDELLAHVRLDEEALDMLQSDPSVQSAVRDALAAVTRERS